jgi:uncharacterized protein YqhQ
MKVIVVNTTSSFMRVGFFLRFVYVFDRCDAELHVVGRHVGSVHDVRHLYGVKVPLMVSAMSSFS